MITAATAQSEKYTAEINATKDSFFTGGELGEMLNQNTMQSQYLEKVKNLRIPQFYIKGEPDLFGSTYEFLETENLSEGFSLSGQDAQISFELVTGEMYQVDIQEQGKPFQNTNVSPSLILHTSENIWKACLQKTDYVNVHP